MIHHLLRKTALTVPVAALALAVSSAWAAPVGPSDASFYNVPASLSGQAGDLIQYRPTTVKLGTDAPSTQAFNVIYQSTDSLNKPNAVSGTVIVPTTAYAGGGARPVLVYAIGTHGLAGGCSPSRQFEVGKDYEAANIVAALKAGYAVLVSDYAGYLNGQQATYLSGKSQGQAVLDLFRAATNIPSVGFSMSSRLGIWGYSQGGQTAAWAGELLSTYAPELKVVGVAAGGIPGDFMRTARNLDGNIGFAFLASGVSGLGTQYPNTIGRNFNLLASASGKAEMSKLQTECVFQALFEHENQTLSQYTNDPANTSLDDILGVPAVADTLTAQDLGRNKINVPLYQFHGQADEFIPLDQEMALKKKYCALGTPVAFDLYPSEHIATMTQAAPKVLSWMADRFAGTAAPSTCATTKADPVSTNATPNGGDFIVKMDKWKLASNVHLKTLMQDFPEPDTSTFTANVNLTAKKIVGQVNIPDFAYPVKIIGIPFSTGMSIKPAADMTGTVSLDNDGTLHVHGSVPMNITITSLMGIPFGQCKMVEPVVFPLDFDGPIASFGNGKLIFNGATTFPQIKGCFISGILTALVSGSGQQFTFTITPPAPVDN